MSCLNYDNPFASDDFSIFLYLTYPNTNDGDFFTAAHFYTSDSYTYLSYIF